MLATLDLNFVLQPTACIMNDMIRNGYVNFVKPNI